MIRYFNVERIEEIHNKVINKSGGLDGFKDKNGISQIIDFMKNDLYYPTFEEKLGYLMFSISKNHFFNDGNKRTSISVGAYFLVINGYTKKIDLFITDMEDYIIELVENKISRDEFNKLLKKYF